MSVLETTAVSIRFGGLQALQWARVHGDDVDHAIVVGAYDHLRAQAIAQNTMARDAISGIESSASA